MLYIINQFLALSMLFVNISNAIRCFQCGSEAIFMDYESSVRLPPSEFERQENTALTLESCANLEFAFTSWGMYAVDCPPEQVCVKTILDNGFDENGRHQYVTGSRGCSMRNSSRGEQHWMGCGVYKTNIVPPSETQDQWDLVCFCDTDYCNGAMRMTQVNLMSVIGYALILSFLTWLQIATTIIK